MKKKPVSLSVVVSVLASVLFFATPICAYGISPLDLFDAVPYFRNPDGSISRLVFCEIANGVFLCGILFRSFFSFAFDPDLERTDTGIIIQRTIVYLYALFSISLGVCFEVELLSGNLCNDDGSYDVRNADGLLNWSGVSFGSLLIFVGFFLLPLIFIWEQRRLEKKLSKLQKQEQYSQTSVVINPNVVDATDEFDELLQTARQERLKRS